MFLHYYCLRFKICLLYTSTRHSRSSAEQVHGESIRVYPYPKALLPGILMLIFCKWQESFRIWVNPYGFAMYLFRRGATMTSIYFLACVGFGLVYNIQGAGILICGFGGALGWFFYLLCLRIVVIPILVVMTVSALMMHPCL